LPLWLVLLCESEFIMATITALNVRLGMDASNFSAGADLARSEVSKVASVLRQSEPPAKKFQKEIELLDRAFSDAGKKTKEYADAVEFLRKKHGQVAPDITKASSAVDSMKQSMLNAVPGGNMLTNALKGPMGAALAAGAAFAVLSREVAAAAQRIDETAKAARGLGIAYRDMIALQMLAGEVGGIDAAGMNRGMGLFVRKIAEARVNGGALAETMRALGLNVSKLAAMNPADAFAEAADVIRGIPDHAERVRVAVALFGKEGIKFVDILAQGSAGLEKMRQESERLGTAISDEAAASVETMNDAFGRAKNAVEGIWNSVTVSLAPALTSVAKLVEDFLVAVRMSGREADKMVPIFDTISAVVIRAIDTMRLAVAVVNDIGGLLSLLPGFTGTVNTDFTETNRLLDEIEGRSNGFVAATKSASEAAEELAVAQQRAADEAAKVQESYEKRIQQLQIESVALAGNTEEAERMRLVAEGYSRAQADSIVAMQQQNALIKERAESEKKAADEAAKRTAELAKQQEKVAADRLKEIERAKKAAEDAFTKDIEQAMAAAKQYFEQERQRDNERRKAIAAGPSSMEFGSAGAAKFMADQANARIGAAAVPDRPTPGEKAIADKTQELLIAQREANNKHDKELEAMKLLLVQFKENGFRRVR
jgi:hypothetical protein